MLSKTPSAPGLELAGERNTARDYLYGTNKKPLTNNQAYSD
jgi:hypothetical protein